MFCNPDEPTRSVMVQPGWNINGVCLCLQMRVCARMCTRVCLGCQAALLDIGVDPCVSGLHMAEVLFKRGGFGGSILYEETQGKEEFFCFFFHSVDFHSDRILHFQALML